MTLTPERWQEVLRLHEAAGELAPEECEAFLVGACSDAELLAEVRRMLEVTDSGDFLEPPRLAPPPPPGRNLGDFTLLDEIGQGGMGVVYRARQRGLERIVAVKVLRPGFAFTARQVDRFTREPKTVARLSHPNLVSILTVGEERGERFFAMEYVDGKNLAEELVRLRADRAAENDRRAHLPSSHASDYFASVAEAIRQAADALAYAHANGIVHRDVKPSNLLLDPSGRVKVVDFGIARDEEQGTISRTEDRLGTLPYMSPEQVLKQRDGVDQRTDIYSLGVVLFELLTLRLPFSVVNEFELAADIVKREPPRVRRLNPRVPRDLETICTKAMAKDPRDRYATAAELRDDLKRFLRHEAIVARPPTVLQLAEQFLRRNARVALAVALLGVGLTVGSALAVKAGRDESLKERLAGLRALAQLDDWSAVEGDRLREGRIFVGELDGRTGIPGVDVPALAQRFAALRTGWIEQARGYFQAARKSESSSEVGNIDESAVAEGLRLVTRVLIVFPGDAEVERLTDDCLRSLMPLVSVRAHGADGAPLAGRVFLRTLDQVSGQPKVTRALGSLPLLDVPIQPGYCRFVVVAEGQDPREFTRLLRRGDPPSTIDCAVRADQDIRAHMVRIEAAELRIPKTNSGCAMSGRVVPVAAFWIDEAPVSMAEFRTFVAATGRTMTSEWNASFPDLPDTDDLPCVGMSWGDARDYAEWVGKRLVTHAEWELAARGPNGFKYFDDVPDEPDQGSYQGNVFAPLPDAENWSELAEVALEYMKPVRMPEARGRNGLYHMLGNVYQWTESLAYEPFDEGDVTRYEPRPDSRVILGSPWFAKAAGNTLEEHQLQGADPRYANPKAGFRCARSDRIE